MTDYETYRIEIQASDAEGTLWQTMHVDRTPTLVLAEDLPEATDFELTSEQIPARAGTLWKPFDATPVGVGGIPHIKYRAYRMVSAQELAEDVAQNQSVAEGEGWRVRIYRGDSDTHIAEAGPGVPDPDLGDLVDRMRTLPTLPPVDRAREAAALAPLVKTALARTRRAAVYEGTRGLPWSEVAAQLGISEAAINQLVTQHRAQA